MSLASRIGPSPTYVIRTKHHDNPRTYFGASFERAGRSSVFAFASRTLATQVAQGLEAYRRSSGHFPPMCTETLELGIPDDLQDLDMLEIEEMDAPRLAALVEGSGVVICYMRMDDEDEDLHAHVVYDKRITRTWIDDMYRR